MKYLSFFVHLSFLILHYIGLLSLLLRNTTDHIAHHILTLYALGASSDVIQKQYERNKSYQRPPEPVDRSILENMHDPTKFHGYLGNEKYYHDFLVYFQGEIDKMGYERVINEYLLKDDERANDLLVRTYAGMHCIHLVPRTSDL